jgi:hypothetical protein
MGTGYIAHALHVNLPILRWQDNSQRARAEVTAPQFTLQGAESGSLAATLEAGTQATAHEPSPTIQAFNIYLGLISGVMTIVTFAVWIDQLAK